MRTLSMSFPMFKLWYYNFTAKALLLDNDAVRISAIVILARTG